MNFYFWLSQCQFLDLFRIGKYPDPIHKQVGPNNSIGILAKRNHILFCIDTGRWTLNVNVLTQNHVFWLKFPNSWPGIELTIGPVPAKQPAPFYQAVSTGWWKQIGPNRTNVPGIMISWLRKSWAFQLTMIQWKNPLRFIMNFFRLFLFLGAGYIHGIALFIFWHSMFSPRDLYRTKLPCVWIPIRNWVFRTTLLLHMAHQLRRFVFSTHPDTKYNRLIIATDGFSKTSKHTGTIGCIYCWGNNLHS